MSRDSLQLLDLKPDELSAVLKPLSVRDRLALGAACSGLREASLGWFPDVKVRLPVPSKVQGLCEWLVAREARVHVRIPHYWEAEPTSDDMTHSLQALRGASVVAITGSSANLSFDIYAADLPAAALEGHTALAELDMNQQELTGSLQVLQRLPQLRHLQLQAPVLRQQIMQGRLAGARGLRSLTLHDWHFPGHYDKELPPSIGSLKQLTALSLPGADFGAPRNLRRLRGLKQLLALSLPRCGLDRVPAEVSALTRLTHLDLGGNRDMHAAGNSWRHLAALQQLASLDLSQCSLWQLPEAVSSLGASLTALDISDNPLEATSLEHLAPLQQLRQLDLHSCKLEELPASIAGLSTLEQLHIRDNQLAAVPSSAWERCFKPLTRLGPALDLSWCELEELPAALTQLTQLRVLDLNHNSISGGWQHLAMLQQLRGLRISHNALVEVPHQLSLLTCLIALDIEGNAALGGSWEALMNLPSLRFVDAMWCATDLLPRDEICCGPLPPALKQLRALLEGRKGELLWGAPKAGRPPFIESQRALLYS